MSIETYNRKTGFSELSEYCHLAGKDSFMEVTEWKNMEGYDIHIARNYSVDKFSLTLGEYELLQVLMNYKGEIK
jgi:hypothetical protein